MDTGVSKESVITLSMLSVITLTTHSDKIETLCTVADSEWITCRVYQIKLNIKPIYSIM